MEWYFAEGQERRGPITEEALRANLASGRLTPDTLIWRQGMADWAPVRTTLVPDLPPPGEQRCIITGKFFPISQMIQTEHGWVSAEGRDTYYQCQREGVPLPGQAGTNARADGKHVVIPTENPQLPLRCFKTNEPVAASEVRTRTLYWCSPWYAITILLSVLIYLILYYVTRKKVVVGIPLSANGRARRTKHVLIAWAFFVVGVLGCITPTMTENFAPFVLLGVILILVSLIYGITRGSLTRVVKLRDGQAWLSGAGADFIASLPPYT
jgi:hypothetical protein